MIGNCYIISYSEHLDIAHCHPDTQLVHTAILVTWYNREKLVKAAPALQIVIELWVSSDASFSAETLL